MSKYAILLWSLPLLVLFSGYSNLLEEKLELNSFHMNESELRHIKFGIHLMT